MNREKNCNNFIEELEKADHMNKTDYDEEGNEVIIKLDIPEGIKEKAINGVQQFASSEYQRHSLYSGQVDLADINYYIEEKNNSIVLVFEMDIGMKHHNYFYGAESFLYGISLIDQLEKQQAENRSL